MKESDFPTKEVEKLNGEINRLRNDFHLFLQKEVKLCISEVKLKLNRMEGVLTQRKDTTGMLFM
jgi:hypothetical protein